MKKNPTKKYFRPTKIFDQKIFDKKFFDFFSTKKKSEKKSRSPISIPNLPKIPKIIFITPCGEYKYEKSKLEEFRTLMTHFDHQYRCWSSQPQIRTPECAVTESGCCGSIHVASAFLCPLQGGLARRRRPDDRVRRPVENLRRSGCRATIDFP